MQSVESCFRNSPDHCEGCPEYKERRYGAALQLISTSTKVLPHPPQHKNAIVKECKRHHKRKVEFLKR